MSKSASDTPVRKPVARQTSGPVDEDPPAYTSGPSSTSPAHGSIDNRAQPFETSATFTSLVYTPSIDFSNYVIRSSSLSKDSITRTLYHAGICSDPTALEDLLQAQLQLPPIPIIRIQGHRWEGEGHEDFDLKLNALPFILRGRDGREWNQIKCLEKGELGFRGGATESVTPSVENGVRGWIRRFCEDKAQHKSFTIRRVVVGWDTEYLEGQLRMLLASKIGYTGHVKISFQFTQSVVTVHTPNPPGFLEHASSFIFSGKKKEVRRYEAVRSIWMYSRSIQAETGERKRIPAVKSEAEWLSLWKQAIRLAVCGKRKGWVSAEDRMEALLMPEKGEVRWKDNEPAPYG